MGTVREALERRSPAAPARESRSERELRRQRVEPAISHGARRRRCFVRNGSRRSRPRQQMVPGEHAAAHVVEEHVWRGDVHARLRVAGPLSVGARDVAAQVRLRRRVAPRARRRVRGCGAIANAARRFDVPAVGVERQVPCDAPRRGERRLHEIVAAVRRSARRGRHVLATAGTRPPRRRTATRARRRGRTPTRCSRSISAASARSLITDVSENTPRPVHCPLRRALVRVHERFRVLVERQRRAERQHVAHAVEHRHGRRRAEVLEPSRCARGRRRTRPSGSGTRASARDG